MKLSELRKLSAADLYDQWSQAKFPFDYMQYCGHCLTQHGGLGTCQMPRHFAVVERITALRSQSESGPFGGEFLQKHLEELFAMRLFNAEFYRFPVPQDVLEEEKEAAHQEELVTA